MEAHLRELADLLVRWVHFIAGIMWIGNSLLFNWLDRNLVKVTERPGHVGEIWMVHSGGFYQVEKKFLAPNELPAVLHWFKWQNGITWLSGILLLVVVYYLGGGALLRDPSVADLSPDMLIAIGVGTVVGSWFIYDLLWRSPLGRAGWPATALSFALLFGVAWGLTQVMSGRAAFIHVGVVMGTAMTGNVWFVILPSQRELLAATVAGREQDPSFSHKAKQRSIHNNYMTFPLLFIMVSNHFPSTWGMKLNWLVLFVVMVAGAGVRHFMNIRFHFRRWLPAAGAFAACGLAGLYVLTAPPAAQPVASAQPDTAPPKGPDTPALAAAAKVPFSQVRDIIASRCAVCHSATPTDSVWKIAPLGVKLDTPEEMKAQAARIKLRAFDQRSMPLGNQTGMTDEERAVLARWVDEGAEVP